MCGHFFEKDKLEGTAATNRARSSAVIRPLRYDDFKQAMAQVLAQNLSFSHEICMCSKAEFMGYIIIRNCVLLHRDMYFVSESW